MGPGLFQEHYVLCDDVCYADHKEYCKLSFNCLVFLCTTQKEFFENYFIVSNMSSQSTFCRLYFLLLFFLLI